MKQADSQIDETAVPISVDWSLAVCEHRPWIERLISSRTGKADLADELVQELSLAVVQSETRPTRPSEVAPWLCTIVIRLCARVVRDRARLHRKLDGFRHSKQAEEDTNRDPIFWLLHQEQREIVREELTCMEPEMRQLLVWKYVQGMSYSMIGARLSTTKHVAEYRVIGARQELRRRLEARGIGEEPSL